MARPSKKTTLIFLSKVERRRGTTPHTLITTHEFATRRELDLQRMAHDDGDRVRLHDDDILVLASL